MSNRRYDDMEWHSVNEKPRNGEEVLCCVRSEEYGDAYYICTFFKKNTIVQDDYSIDDKVFASEEDRLLEILLNPENRGKKIVQKDCFCSLEMCDDGLFKWINFGEITHWARIYDPDGSPSKLLNVEIFDEGKVRKNV